MTIFFFAFNFGVKWFVRLSFFLFFRRTECEAQVKGFAGAIFKKFKSTDEANDFVIQKRPASAPAQTKRAAAVSAPKPALSVRTDLFPSSTVSAHYYFFFFRVNANDC